MLCSKHKDQLLGSLVVAAKDDWCLAQLLSQIQRNLVGLQSVFLLGKLSQLLASFIE
ncbi:MAG TPA: hypothetical protein VKX46_02325 [Ktedonobacteraceae bacterium]|nr:hypothetical protein [Ktedonobacteraceae bacterium]